MLRLCYVYFFLTTLGRFNTFHLFAFAYVTGVNAEKQTSDAAKQNQYFFLISSVISHGVCRFYLYIQ